MPTSSTARWAPFVATADLGEANAIRDVGRPTFRLRPGRARGLARREWPQTRGDEPSGRRGQITGELLVAAARDHALPIRHVDDLVDLETDVRVGAHHPDL